MLEVTLVIAAESVAWDICCVDKSFALLVIVEFVLCLIKEPMSSTVYHIFFLNYLLIKL